MVNVCVDDKWRFYTFHCKEFPEYGDPPMRRVYDIFEKFPDGSTLWRASVPEQCEAERIMLEWAEYSANEFFLFEADDFLPTPLLEETPST
jgi:hypothetical protein